MEEVDARERLSRAASNPYCDTAKCTADRITASSLCL